MTIFKKDCIKIKFDGADRWICPKCFNHTQLECGDYDCKTIIYENELTADGKLVTFCQCCCYSKEHK